MIQKGFTAIVAYWYANKWNEQHRMDSFWITENELVDFIKTKYPEKYAEHVWTNPKLITARTLGNYNEEKRIHEAPNNLEVVIHSWRENK